MLRIAEPQPRVDTARGRRGELEAADAGIDRDGILEDEAFRLPP